MSQRRGHRAYSYIVTDVVRRHVRAERSGYDATATQEEGSCVRLRGLGYDSQQWRGGTLLDVSAVTNRYLSVVGR